jgi:hypothetical protein
MAERPAGRGAAGPALPAAVALGAEVEAALGALVPWAAAAVFAPGAPLEAGALLLPPLPQPSNPSAASDSAL